MTTALGEIKRGEEIGRKPLSERFIWAACMDCGKERWVMARRGLPFNRRCRGCALRAHPNNFPSSRGEKNPNWKGGRRYLKEGYIQLLLQPDDFFFLMAGNDGYVLEHRLVMAKHVSRCLLAWEVVHHRNGIRDDNRLENLHLIAGRGDHASFNLLQAANRQLEKQVRQLAQRVILLEAELVVIQARDGVPLAGA